MTGLAVSPRGGVFPAMGVKVHILSSFYIHIYICIHTYIYIYIYIYLSIYIYICWWALTHPGNDGPGRIASRGRFSRHGCERAFLELVFLSLGARTFQALFFCKALDPTKNNRIGLKLPCSYKWTGMGKFALLRYFERVSTQGFVVLVIGNSSRAGITVHTKPVWTVISSC